MRLRTDIIEETSDEPEEAPEQAIPMTGYRVAGDLHVRSAELEQELAEEKERVRDVERKLFAANNRLRRHKGATAMSHGGIGATLGSFLGTILYGTDVITTPYVLPATVLITFFLGAIVGFRWEELSNKESSKNEQPPQLPPGTHV